MIVGLALVGCGDDSSGQTTAAGSSSSSTGPGEGSTGDPGTTTTDPGTTTTGQDTTADESTGPGVACGNGKVDDDEQCDDENTDNDDECYSDCTLPYEEQWAVTFDEGDDDFARDAVLDADGNLYVIGASQIEGEGYDLWVRQYTPEGRDGWTWFYPGAPGQDAFGRSIAWTADGDLMLAGTETTDTGDDVLVIRLQTSDQTIVWSDIYDGPGSGAGDDDDDFGNDVAVDVNGDVLVSATHRVDDQQWDLWLRKYDADGNELWTHTSDAVGGNDFADAVVTDSNGDIYLAASVDTSVMPTVSEGWVRKLDTDGNELWTETLPGVLLNGATVDAMDNLVLVGWDDQSGTAPDLWIGRYDADFTELDAAADDYAGLADFVSGVAVGASGDVYVAGSVAITGQVDEIWAGRYAADLGQRWWNMLYGNKESNLSDVGNAIVVNDDESRVVVLGYESVIGQDRNVWIRSLRNYPTPGS